MVRRRGISIVVLVVMSSAILAYLRDPPWLIDQTSGLHGWEQPPGQPRYRWSTAHASFFVPADTGTFDIPVSTPMMPGDDTPMLVSVTVDDVLAARMVLTDGSWQPIHVTLPAPGSRRVRRIDLRTNVTRRGFLGVRVGELVFPRRLAGRLLRFASRGT